MTNLIRSIHCQQRQQQKKTARKRIGAAPTVAAARRRLRARGMALLGIMMVLLLMLTLILLGIFASGNAGGASGGKKSALGALGVADATVTSASARMRYYGSLNLAETGARMALEWLTEQSSLTATNSPLQPDATFSGSTLLENGTYRKVAWDNSGSQSGNYFAVHILPYTSNLSNTQQKFLIESVGRYQGMTQIVRVIARQDSFANYALFLNSTPGSPLVSGNNIYGGPVHFNGTEAVNILWKKTTPPNTTTGDSPDQIFKYNQPNAFTTEASTINWHQSNMSDTTTPSGSDMNYVVARGGGIKKGTAHIPMPTSSTSQQTAAFDPAWNGTPPAGLFTSTIPYTTGPVTVNGAATVVPNNGANTTGGIVIQGTVNDMVFSTSPSTPSRQVVTVYQTGSTVINGSSFSVPLRTTITIDRSGTGGTTTVATAAVPPNASGYVNLSTKSYNGTTTGVIYSTNSDINGVHGTVADNVTDASGNIVQRNALTIATTASHNLQLDGDLKYLSHTTDPNSPYEAVGSVDKTRSGMLGIVSNLVHVARRGYDPTTGKTTPDLTSLEIDAIVFAYNTFNADQYNTRSVGVLNLLGGYIADSAGLFGTQLGDGTPKTGFRKANNYDDRVLDNPPPAFPNTANQYTVLSYQRVTDTLDGAYHIGM